MLGRTGSLRREQSKVALVPSLVDNAVAAMVPQFVFAPRPGVGRVVA